MAAELICSRDGLAIYELLASGDNERIEAMLALYAKFFPEYAHYLPRMRRRAAFSGDRREGHLAHYWLFEYQNKPVGLSTFRYISKRKCGIGVSFAIETQSRSIRVGEQRLSAFVIAEIMKTLHEDAAISHNECYGLVTEVEHENLMNHYKTMGMIELPMKYVEPIYPPEEEGDTIQSRIEKLSFAHVYLALTPYKKFALSKALLRDFAEAFLIDHYELPKSHPMVQKTLLSIR